MGVLNVQNWGWLAERVADTRLPEAGIGQSMPGRHGQELPGEVRAAACCAQGRGGESANFRVASAARAYARAGFFV